MIKKHFFSFLLAIFLTLTIGILIYKQIVYPTIIPMVIKGGASLFADWTVVLNANDCLQKGYDVYLENPCDHWNRKHVYGEILLKIPFIKTFSKFYYFFLPIIFSFLFLLTISYTLFDLKNLKYFLFLFILVFSLPVLLVIERSNIDLIIFIFMFLISKFRNNFLNYFLIIFSSISKFYPILFSAIFFYNPSKKKIFFNLFIIISIFLILLGIQYESISKIILNRDQFSGYGYGLYEFSFSGLFKFLNNLNIDLSGNNLNWIKNFYLIFIILIPILTFNYFNYKKIRQFFDDTLLGLNNNFENRIYFLSSTIILFCYFSFSNFIYREIFFLGLIPGILFCLKSNKNYISSFYFYLIVLKFFFTSLLIIFYQNNLLIEFQPIMIILKHTLDLYLVSIILNFYLNYSKLFIRRMLS